MPADLHFRPPNRKPSWSERNPMLAFALVAFALVAIVGAAGLLTGFLT